MLEGMSYNFPLMLVNSLINLWLIDNVICIQNIHYQSTINQWIIII